MIDKRSGFTLVELLIGATLSAAIMAAVFSSYIYLGRSLARLANQQTLETEARRTLGYFTQDVQEASGLAAGLTPSASAVALSVQVANGTNIITYYYNNTASAATVAVNGTNVSMPANALTRCVYDGTSVKALTLLRNITDNNATTTTDLFFRYYDASGSPYDNGSAPFTTVTTYSLGIKQLSLQFRTQLGTARNGTLTPVNQVVSSRLALRNRGLLP